MRRNRLFLTLGISLLPASYAVAIFTSIANLNRVYAPFASRTSPIAAIGVAAAVQLIACLFSIISAASGPKADPWVIWGNTLALLMVFSGNIYSACLSGSGQSPTAAVLSAGCIVLITLHSPEVFCRWLALLVKSSPEPESRNSASGPKVACTEPEQQEKDGG